MAEHFILNGKHVTVSELFRGASNPISGLLYLLLKIFHLPISTFSDIPAVRDLGNFEISQDDLSPEVFQAMDKELASLKAMGFTPCLYHQINEAKNLTTHQLITLTHKSGQAFAQIHDLAIHAMIPAKRRYFVSFYTQFADGDTLLTTSAKPDWDDPQTFDAAYYPKDKPQALWEKHQSRLHTQPHRKVIPAQDVSQVRDLLQFIHNDVVENLLQRGLFEPDPQPTNEDCDAVEDTTLQTYAPDVLAVSSQIVKDQNKTQNTQATLLILLISAGLFVGLGASAWSMRFVLLLIPILLFHELGHWVAMKIFRYRNLKMFFIPLLGAAVTGQSYNVAGWKKVIVYLAGPIPGLVFGTLFCLAGVMQSNSLYGELGSLMLVINVMNLLPILPLDGGWVMHLILFSRHPILQVIFRGLTVLGLLGLFLLFNDRFILFLAIYLGINTPAVWKTAQATEDLKKLDLDLEPDATRVIRLSTLDAILSKMKKVYTKPILAKSMAVHCMSVYESLAASRPGVWSSLGFGMVQFGGMAAGALLLMMLLIGNQGFPFSQTAPLPQAVYKSGSLQTRDTVTPELLTADRVTLIGKSAEESQALEVYDLIEANMPKQTTLTRFGRIVMLEMPADQTALRNRWFETFEQKGLEPRVQTQENKIAFNLAFTVATQEKAKQLIEIANQSQCTNSAMVLPWHPTIKLTDAQRKARHTIRLLNKRQGLGNMTQVIESMLEAPDSNEIRRKQIQEKMIQANRRGDEQAIKLLKDQLEDINKQEEQLRVSAIRQRGESEVDMALIDLYESQNNYVREDDPKRGPDQYAKHWQAYTLKLNQLLGVIPEDDLLAMRYGMGPFYMTSTNLLLHTRALRFNYPAVGLPNYIHWLESQNCQAIRYDLVKMFNW